MADILKLDLYELLNVSHKVDVKEIKKAYRKKALSCHPDKNPDNPRAAELFQQLSKALELLTDEAARAAYDQVLKARKTALVRNRELDYSRKKLKEDLETREQSSKNTKASNNDATKKLQKEIERLRKEGSKQLEEERELLKVRIAEEKKKSVNEETSVGILPRLKVKWKVQKGDTNNGGYTQENLWDIFQQHGGVTCLVVSSKKKGSAIVEFDTMATAQSVFGKEIGNVDNPLVFIWVNGSSQQSVSKTVEGPNEMKKKDTPIPEEGSALTSRDYESLVLMKLRQAEERKKLIQQMLKDDELP